MGAPASVAATSPEIAIAPPIAIGTMTRVWPKRSIRRPCTGLAIALEIASAAVTAPALANEPVSRWTMSTIASGAPTLRPAIIADPTTAWTWRLRSSSP